MGVLGTKLRSSGKATGTVNHRAIFPFLLYLLVYFSLKKLLMCMGVLLDMSAHHKHAVPVEARRGRCIPGTGVADGCELSCDVGN